MILFTRALYELLPRSTFWKISKQHINKYTLPQTLTDKECMHLDAFLSSDSSPADNHIYDRYRCQRTRRVLRHPLMHNSPSPLRETEGGNRSNDYRNNTLFQINVQAEQCAFLPENIKNNTFFLSSQKFYFPVSKK